MFMNIRKQKGLEILEYGVIAAIVIGIGAAAYVTLAGKVGTSTTTVGNCLDNPKTGCSSTTTQ